jgi:hypothetical protein
LLTFWRLAKSKASGGTRLRAEALRRASVTRRF